MSVPQTGRYSLRLTTIAGQAAVFVINETNQQIYTVTAQRRCNCPHFVHRCAGTGRVCKHVELADAFVQGEPCATCPATVKPAEAAVSTRSLGEVECASCRDTARKPYLDPERAARIERSRREMATLWP